MEFTDRDKSCKFFYGVLISLDDERISETIKSLEKSSELIEDQITDMCVYMDGGVTYTEARRMSHLERNRMLKKLNHKIQNMTGKEWL